MKNFIYPAVLALILISGCKPPENKYEKLIKQYYAQLPEGFDKFLINKDELNLRFKYTNTERKLSYKNYEGSYADWQNEIKQKFVELVSYEAPGEKQVKELRTKIYDGITYHALAMEVSPQLSISAYLLSPEGKAKGTVMAIHGHGFSEPAIGMIDDYHHKFAYELAKSGYMVLCPELRGFGTLGDLADDIALDHLDYGVFEGRQFTLVTEGFQHGKNLIGETISDLVAWENWLADVYHVKSLDVAGISYGGDLALYYPVFSSRVNKIFCSGSMGSFNGIFATSYNAPAHCIPNILKWMDRSDIAGLNAPRPIMIHYGELDVPGPKNHSASYNESVQPALNELKEIYAMENARDKIYLKVTPNSHHEMDNQALKAFLSGDD